MVLEVGLITAVQTIVVEHCVHAGIVGIMACTDGVDVVALHQQNILEHIVCSNGATCNGVGIMTVNTLEYDTLAVDIEQRTDNLNLANTNLGRECHHVLASVVLLYDVQSVEGRSLGCPHLSIVNKELGLACLEGLL